MAKYRVTLPIDFGDGVVHWPGETVEPDAKKAQAYRHALFPVETDADVLARTIRELRARLGLTLMKFGKLIGVSHTQISRYESGSDSPGYFPLWHLVTMADGAEKNPFLKRLGDLLPQPIENATEIRLRSEYQKYGFTLPGDISEAAQKTERARKNAPEFMPHLTKLAQAVSQLCFRRKEVDASLAEIVCLWLSVDDSNPAVRQRFADAATYLKAELGSKPIDKTTPRPKKTA